MTNLEYIGNKKRTWKEKFFSYSKIKNIIRGNYNNEKIEIFDFETYTDDCIQSSKNKIIGTINNIAKTTSFQVSPGNINKIILTYVNNKAYKDKILPYLSTKKIERLLNNNIFLKEFGVINFNKGLFWVILLTSLCATFIIDQIIFFSYSISIIKILIFSLLLNIILLYINIKIAKKSTYKVVIMNDPKNKTTFKK